MEFVEEQNGHLESGSSTSDGNGQETVGTATDLEHTAVRRVYLVTYSQANLEHFPKRRSFAQADVGSFSKANGKVLQWVCCRESHENGGHHYHLAFKLDRCQRWLSSKNYMREHHGITVHFSNLHYNYYSAWRYVTKRMSMFCRAKIIPICGIQKLLRQTLLATSAKKSVWKVTLLFQHNRRSRGMIWKTTASK